MADLVDNGSADLSSGEKVRLALLREIVSGRLPPGRQLNLRRLALDMGVSYIPVRDALSSLWAEGLVTHRFGYTAKVAETGVDELRRVCWLRRAIEPELAARSCTTVDFDELGGLGHVLVKHLAEVDPSDESYDVYREAYFRLVSPAASAFELRIVRMLQQAHEQNVRAASIRSGNGRPYRSLAKSLLQLISIASRRDPERTRTAATRHIDLGEEVAVRALARS